MSVIRQAVTAVTNVMYAGFMQIMQIITISIAINRNGIEAPLLSINTARLTNKQAARVAPEFTFMRTGAANALIYDINLSSTHLCFLVIITSRHQYLDSPGQVLDIQRSRVLKRKAKRSLLIDRLVFRRG